MMLMWRHSNDIQNNEIKLQINMLISLTEIMLT